MVRQSVIKKLVRRVWSYSKDIWVSLCLLNTVKLGIFGDTFGQICSNLHDPYCTVLSDASSQVYLSMENTAGLITSLYGQCHIGQRHAFYQLQQLQYMHHGLTVLLSSFVSHSLSTTIL